jgi:hypothetical protein
MLNDDERGLIRHPLSHAIIFGLRIGAALYLSGRGSCAAFSELLDLPETSLELDNPSLRVLDVDVLDPSHERLDICQNAIGPRPRQGLPSPLGQLAFDVEREHPDQLT